MLLRYAANGHTHPRPDGLIEYSATAFAAMHAVSRQTCQEDGTDITGGSVTYNLGFFHRSTSSDLTTEEFFLEAMQKFEETQCIYSNGGYSANQQGLRNYQNSWTPQSKETNLNMEGFYFFANFKS